MILFTVSLIFSWFILVINFDVCKLWMTYLCSLCSYLCSSMNNLPYILFISLFRQEAFLLINEECKDGESFCHTFGRKLVVQWKSLFSHVNGAVLATFFDIYEDVSHRAKWMFHVYVYVMYEIYCM